MREESRPDEVDELMRQLGVDPAKLPKPPAAPAPVPEPPGPAPIPGARVEFEPLAPLAEVKPAAGLDFLGDVNVQVRIELGRTRLSVQDILKLGSGSVVPLESLTTDPVDVFVNDRLVARGEVLVVDDNFAVRITEVVTPASPAPRPGA
jgi:flagellar motor switch protein FliN/FliY